jgi:hypothetical protein
MALELAKPFLGCRDLNDRRHVLEWFKRDRIHHFLPGFLERLRDPHLVLAGKVGGADSRQGAAA